MASGDTIFILGPTDSKAPATLFALLDTILDASTPNAVIPVLKFDPTTAWFMDWFLTVPSYYDGGGFTLSWKGGTDNTSVGTLILDILMTVIADAAIQTGDLGFDTGTGASITDTPPTTPINKMNQSGTATISHANAGSPSPGDRINVRGARNVATDTNTGFLQLNEILILET